MAKYQKLLAGAAVLAALALPRLAHGGVVQNPTREEFLVYVTEVFGPEAQTFYNIVDCESDFLQWKDDGDVVISHTMDIGISQINLDTWDLKMTELHLDIFKSWKDNVKMAHYIYKTQGFDAWVCYKKTIRLPRDHSLRAIS